MTVFEKIEAQQKGKENTDIWMVGEQLKDICRHEPKCADIVAADLENGDMSIQSAAKKIKEYAHTQKHKQKTNCVCVPPDIAEQIIRDFYGLPSVEMQSPEPSPVNDNTGGLLDLDSFL